MSSLSVAEADAVHKLVRKTAFWVLGVILALVLLVWGWMLATPRYNLYKKNTEKQAVIAEQKAKSEAAEYEAKSTVTQAKSKAEAERERAKGLRDAQEIISATLTEEYLRYLYIDAVAGQDGQIIYIPTEAGLPILEAGRGVGEPTTTTQPED